MDSEFKVFWKDEAINNLESILNYLKNRWAQRDIDNFKKRLCNQIKLIENNEGTFPVPITIAVYEKLY